jgi:hypothetical protein
VWISVGVAVHDNSEIIINFRKARRRRPQTLQPLLFSKRGRTSTV